MNDRKRRHPYDFGSLAGLLTLLIVSALALAPVLERLELRTHDLRFHLRGPRQSNTKVVIVEVDAPAFDQWKGPLASWGNRWARVIHQARAAGARAVGLDVEMPVAMDDYLRTATAEAFRLAGLPESQFLQAEPRFVDSDTLRPDLQMVNEIDASPGFVVLGHALSSPIRPDLKMGSAEFGLTNPAEKADDAVRLMHLQMGGERTFAAALAAKANGALRHPQTGSLFWINYVRTTPDATFRRIPILRIAGSALTPEDRAGLKDAVVLIGVRDRAFNDWMVAPGGREMTGPEINAHAIATLADGRQLKRASFAVEALTALVVSLAAGALTLSLRFWKSLLVFMIAAAAWFWLCISQFAGRDLLLPMVWPMVGLGAPFAVCHVTRAAAERRNRMQLEQVFGPYIAPRIREFLMASPLHRKPGGIEGKATVMFFDLRDSTPFAERRGPADVIQQLNELFERVVPEVVSRQGLILRYTGDGFLAVFGVPVQMENHAGAAVSAAVKLSAAIAKLNRERLEKELEPWKFGCGIHTGRLVYGNLGTAERPEFTLIGDTVNLAARLQDACKELDWNVVISEAVWLAAGRPSAEGPINYQAKGRSEKVMTYLPTLSADELPRTPVETGPAMRRILQ